MERGGRRGRQGFPSADQLNALSNEEAARLVLSLIPRQTRPLVEELRALVREVVPAVKEKPHPGWKTFNFDHNGALVAISGYANYASLGCVRGAQLDDPQKLLEGTGKGMRHVKVDKGTEVPREALTALLEQAAELNATLGPPPGIGRAWGGGRA